MFRYLLPLLLMASPAWAQEERIATLDSNGRVLRVPLADGYTQLSSDGPKLFDAFSALMRMGKVDLIEMLATEQDLARLNERLAAQAMLYKISTDPLFGVSIVGEQQWATAKPQYEKDFSGIDTQKVTEDLRQKVDAFAKEHGGENPEFEVRLGEVSRPTLYRSDSASSRFHALLPATITSKDGAQAVLFLSFGALVYLDGRVFIVAGEVTAPKDAEGFVRERGNFERFVDRVIALNGAKVRL